MKEKTLLYYTDKGELLTFENYTINENGVVKNKYGKILKSKKEHNNYHRITIMTDNNKKQVYVHRAILSTFKSDEYFKNAQANHIDENKDNNVLDNLEWLSPKDNANHGTRNDRISKKVLCYDLNNNFVREYETIKDTEKDGFDRGNVSKCCKGKRKTHKKHKFYYKN